MNKGVIPYNGPETIPKGGPVRKMKTAAYCRVSRDSLSQQTSIDHQREYYENLIRSNPDWEFAGIYWEAGRSGTGTAGRPALQQLLADCQEGKIDLILTKSVSRFFRNTADCLRTVRILKALGVDIRFEKENLDTLTPSGELMLTLYSSFAEEESRSVSENIAWGVRKRFETGTFRFSKAPYGYFLEDGNLSVNPEEAAVVETIFSSALKGLGTPAIARELNRRKIPAGSSGDGGTDVKWTSSRLLYILKNPVYTGDVLLQKTWHGDDFRRRVNTGEKKQYYLENHHEPIINKETFHRAAAVRSRGTAEKAPDAGAGEGKPSAGRSCFTGKLFCGCCGAPLKRITQKTAKGKRFHWGCTAHLKSAARCPMRREQEESIRNAFLTLLNKLVYMEGLLLAFTGDDPVDAAGADKPAAILKAAAAAYRKAPSSSEMLFTMLTDSADITTGKQAVFHLKCGLHLTERLS